MEIKVIANVMIILLINQTIGNNFLFIQDFIPKLNTFSLEF